MIYSMTAFSNARIDLDKGFFTLEIRSINSRFLELQFRLPDECNHLEDVLRNIIKETFIRGKIEIKAIYQCHQPDQVDLIKLNWLTNLAEQLQTARKVIPDLRAPSLMDLFNYTNHNNNQKKISLDNCDIACINAFKNAFHQLQLNRQREGERLKSVMLEFSKEIKKIIHNMNLQLPELMSEYRKKIANKLKETVEAAFPGGFLYISGQELSERLAHDTNLHTLRVDIAEEVFRLHSHLIELLHLFQYSEEDSKLQKNVSTGKRLDFLFQEMNREVNTIGSKSFHLEVTRSVMDLKLLIEQMREQAQNIE